MAFTIPWQLQFTLTLVFLRKAHCYQSREVPVVLKLLQEMIMLVIDGSKVIKEDMFSKQELY